VRDRIMKSEKKMTDSKEYQRFKSF